jgi:protein-tyrosine kinase
MSNIYEALEHAKRRVHVAGPVTESRDDQTSTFPTVVEAPGPEMEEEMISLYQMIAASLPGVEHCSILFIGSASNEGTSTVARQLARTISFRMEKNVLLIDLDRSRPDLHVYAGLKRERSEDSTAASQGDFIDSSLCRVEESSLYVMPLFQTSRLTPKTVESTKGHAFWEPLKDRFDLIIVDAPPASRFPDGLGIASQVDGVVLVVEAEKTRWPVARSARDKILKSGGNIIGIVFNKRKFYIPTWLYKRL